MKITTLNEWLNESESDDGFLEPTKENLEKFGLRLTRTTINPDGSIDYDGNVNLSQENLKRIPFRFNIVQHGDFDCSGNQIRNLEGCPNEIYGNFNCTANELVNLKYFPLKVVGTIDLSWNRLLSTKGFTLEKKSTVRTNANLILYNPADLKHSFNINYDWEGQGDVDDLKDYPGSEILKMSFARLDELDEDEILGIEEGLEKVEVPNDIRAYCENKIFKWKSKYSPRSKVQKIFNRDIEDDVRGMF